MALLIFYYSIDERPNPKVFKTVEEYVAYLVEEVEKKKEEK